MKRIIILTTLLLGIYVRGLSQTILSENFDSYNTSQLLTVVSPGWSSAFAALGMPDSMGVISSTESNSPQNSLFQNASMFIQNDLGITVSSGNLTIQMALKIPTGKRFVFDFGYDDTEVLFSNGIMTVYDPNGVAISSNLNYPQNTWFIFRIEANFDLSTWKNYINNQQAGADYVNFSQTPISSIRMMAFDKFNPTLGNQNIQAWIDDISIIKTNVSLENFDLGLAQIQPDYGVVSQQKKVRTRIQNLGQTIINSATVTMNYDNGAVISVKNLSNLNLQSLDNKIIEFNDPIVLGNNKTIVVTLSNINGTSDDNPNNNSANYVINNLITPAANKKIYIEEATGTWCGFCPQARVTSEWLTHTFGEFVEVAELHDSDPMATPSYNPLSLGVLGFPTIRIDRDTNRSIQFLEEEYTQGLFQNNLFMLPIGANSFLNRLTIAPHAVINPTYTYNSTTRELAVTVDYVFTEATTNYKVACALTEDNITGSGDGTILTDFDQMNYFNGTNHIVTPDSVDLYDLPNIIPASQMVYDHIGRIISPSITGTGISNTTAGQTITQTFNFVVNQNWNPAYIKVIAMLIDDSGHVDNVQSASLQDIFLDVQNAVVNVADFTVYPNPANDNCTIRFSKALDGPAAVTILGIDGRIVKTQTLNSEKETSTYEIDLSTLTEGNYVIQISRGNYFQTFKLIKID